MAAMANQKGGRPTEEEIAAKRAARAAKKAEKLAADEEGHIFTSEQLLTYTFAEHELSIQEDWSGEGSALAGMQWLGGVTLARFVDDRVRYPPGYFSGKSVMEVGAGMGMTSILLALLGADVTLTDLDIGKAVLNVEANLTTAPDARKRLRLATMDWYAPDLERFTLPVDMVVAGDCCYQPAVIEPLMKAMWHMSSASTEILLCGIVTDAALVTFNEVVWKYFDVERVDLASPHDAKPAPLNSDDPTTRLRAFMRLHRLDATKQSSTVSAIDDAEIPQIEVPAAGAAP